MKNFSLFPKNFNFFPFFFKFSYKKKEQIAFSIKLLFNKHTKNNKFLSAYFSLFSHSFVQGAKLDEREPPLDGPEEKNYIKNRKTKKKKK
jgi:hypothetical protein